MRLTWRLGIALAIAPIVFGCGASGGTDGGGDGGGGGGNGLTTGRYVGSMRNVIDHYTIYGQFHSRLQYDHNVEVRIAAPASALGYQESNPLNLQVLWYYPSSNIDQGVFWIRSGAAYPGPVLVQTWQLQFDGYNLTGRLTNPQSALTGTAENGLCAWQNIESIPMFAQFAILEAELSGTITNSEINLQVQGRAYPLTGSQASSEARVFSASIKAVR